MAPDVADEAGDEMLGACGRGDGPQGKWEHRDYLAVLPPLPEPDTKTRRRQQMLGCVFVPGIVAICVACVHIGYHLLEGHLPDGVRYAWLALVYAEAVAALACLAGLLWADPGVVRRSEDTCLPLPELVLTRLRASEPLDTLDSNVEGADGASYCVRCLVWRRRRPPGEDSGSALAEHLCKVLECSGSSKAFHHCSTCQRCVVDFDHHCGFFGRCIAGKGFGGNMGYFKAILALGFAGNATGWGCLLLALGFTEYGYWIAVICGGYFGCVFCMFCSGWLVSCLLSLAGRRSLAAPRGQWRRPGEVVIGSSVISE